jgi:hypothetical protein
LIRYSKKLLLVQWKANKSNSRVRLVHQSSIKVPSMITAINQILTNGRTGMISLTRMKSINSLRTLFLMKLWWLLPIRSSIATCLNFLFVKKRINQFWWLALQVLERLNTFKMSSRNYQLTNGLLLMSDSLHKLVAIKYKTLLMVNLPNWERITSVPELVCNVLCSLMTWTCLKSKNMVPNLQLRSLDNGLIKVDGMIVKITSILSETSKRWT